VVQSGTIHLDWSNTLSFLEPLYATAFAFGFTQLAGQSGTGPNGYGWVMHRTNAPSLAGIGERRIPGDSEMPALDAMKLWFAHLASPACTG
jgi:hypothetical protein